MYFSGEVLMLPCNTRKNILPTTCVSGHPKNQAGNEQNIPSYHSLPPAMSLPNRSVCLTCKAFVVVLYFLTYFGVGVTACSAEPETGGRGGVVSLALNRPLQQLFHAHTWSLAAAGHTDVVTGNLPDLFGHSEEEHRRYHHPCLG